MYVEHHDKFYDEFQQLAMSWPLHPLKDDDLEIMRDSLRKSMWSLTQMRNVWFKWLVDRHDKYRHLPLLVDKVAIWTALENELYERDSMEILRNLLNQQSRKYWKTHDKESRFSRRSSGQSDYRQPLGQDILAQAVMEVLGDDSTDLPQLSEEDSAQLRVFDKTLQEVQKKGELEGPPILHEETPFQEQLQYTVALVKGKLLEHGDGTDNQPDPKDAPTATTTAPANVPASGSGGQPAAQSTAAGGSGASGGDGGDDGD
ncbi:MAG: hypothetical protein GY739_20935, partial [Mesoflavibacter sp.]|nr:hypothetical protein [Mesoflavibacter sp.]